MAFDGIPKNIRVAVLLIAGLATIGYGAYSYSSQTSALDSAVEVDATISSTSIDANEKKGDTYTPQATFNYTYEGKEYTSSNVYPGELPREFSKKDARSELEEYKPGETVTAYVPPESPGNAFLKYKSSNKPLIVIAFGGLIVLSAGRSALK